MLLLLLQLLSASPAAAACADAPATRPYWAELTRLELLTIDYRLLQALQLHLQALERNVNSMAEKVRLQLGEEVTLCADNSNSQFGEALLTDTTEAGVSSELYRFGSMMCADRVEICAVRSAMSATIALCQRTVLTEPDKVTSMAGFRSVCAKLHSSCIVHPLSCTCPFSCADNSS